MPPRALALALLIIFTATQSLSQDQSVRPSTGLMLEDGTPVKLRISRTVSSADAQIGDTVDFDVLEEVRIGNLLLIPKGGLAWATVTEAQPKRRMARGGKLNMNIDSVRLGDGEKAALRAVKEMKGGGHTGAMTGALVATAIVFWPAAPLFLFMHGKDITVPKGTEITAYVNGNFPVDVAKFQGGAPYGQRFVANGAGAGNTTLNIASAPPSAEVELDGSFAGDTPSSLGVSAGEHTIRVSKSGYKSWERKITTATGNVKIAVELVPLSRISDTSETASDNAKFPALVKAVAPTTPRKPQAATLNKPATELAQPLQNSAKILEGSSASITSTPDASVHQDERGYLGATSGDQPRVRHNGVTLSGVELNGPAYKAGLQSSDVLITLDGNYLYTVEDLSAGIRQHGPGSRIAIKYMRGATFYDTYVILEPTPRF